MHHQRFTPIILTSAHLDLLKQVATATGSTLHLTPDLIDVVIPGPFAWTAWGMVANFADLAPDTTQATGTYSGMPLRITCASGVAAA